MKKVRVVLGGALREALGQPEVLAQIPLAGTAEDLLRHLEDAWPGARGLIRKGPLVLDGRAPGPDEALPERRIVRLG